MEQKFALQPFSPGAVTPDITITGVIRRNNNKIEIFYVISGDLQDIVVQPKADIQMRKDNLWKETCLEAFLTPTGSDHYWEVNLSPAGHWNVYRFSAYRAEMKEEPAVISLPISVKMNNAALTLSTDIDMVNFISSNESLHVGISAVIMNKSGRLSYWALAHPGTEPDFHSKESFVLRI